MCRIVDVRIAPNGLQHIIFEITKILISVFSLAVYFTFCEKADTLKMRRMIIIEKFSFIVVILRFQVSTRPALLAVFDYLHY